MIAMLLDGQYPSDIRVRKEAESLVEMGYPVVVICRWSKGQPRREEINSVLIDRIGWNDGFIYRGIMDTLTSIFFIHWIFYFSGRKRLRRYDVDHIHVHDLPLLYTGVLLKRRIKVGGKVIFDMHENYPEMLKEYFMIRKSFFVRLKDRILFYPGRWKKYEQRVIPKSDYIIAVVDEMRTKLINDFPNFRPESILVVSNFERRQFSILQEKDSFEFDPDTFYLVYVGGISPVRGLETVLDALKILKKSFKVAFLIIGKGRVSYERQLKERSSQLGISEEVKFLGYKSFNRINYFMQNASFNIIPHIKNDHTDFTIPHKLFQIFLSKSPVIVSSCRPLKRIVESMNGGFVFTASDENHLADICLQVKHNPLESIHRAENAYRGVIEKRYYWEAEAEKLEELYSTLQIKKV